MLTPASQARSTPGYMPTPASQARSTPGYMPTPASQAKIHPQATCLRLLRRLTQPRRTSRTRRVTWRRPVYKTSHQLQTFAKLIWLWAPRNSRRLLHSVARYREHSSPPLTSIAHKPARYRSSPTTPACESERAADPATNTQIQQSCDRLSEHPLPSDKKTNYCPSPAFLPSPSKAAPIAAPSPRRPSGNRQPDANDRAA